jgi:hypothetical protein
VLNLKKLIRILRGFDRKAGRKKDSLGLAAVAQAPRFSALLF